MADHLHPPIDRELERGVAEFGRVFPRSSDATLERLRRMTRHEQVLGSADLTAGGRVVVEDMIVHDELGELTLLVLRPAEAHAAGPAIYFAHGGGLVMGSRATGVDMFLPYVTELGAVVVSVEYRLAPEARQPAAVEDCYRGLVWLAHNAERCGVDPSRIALAGASAGAGLAAGVALLARDRGFPDLLCQYLLAPMLDDRMVTQSSRMLEGIGAWDSNDNLYGWTAALGSDRGGEGVSEYAAPARAGDLTRLPRAFIEVGSVDIFRDETLLYGMRLSQAGVSVDMHLWGGATHGSEAIVPDAAISRAALAVRDEFWRRLLASPAPSPTQ